MFSGSCLAVYTMVLCFDQPLANFLFRGCLEAACWARHSGQLWTGVGEELLPAHVLEWNVQRLQFQCAASGNQSYTRIVLWEKADDPFGTVSSKCVHNRRCLLTFGVQVDLFDPAFLEASRQSNHWKERKSLMKHGDEQCCCSTDVCNVILPRYIDVIWCPLSLKL